jgi:glycosyltransferase involved in cell wall biosynthesis
MHKKRSSIVIDLTSLSRKCTGIEKYAKNISLGLLSIHNDFHYILVFRNFIDPDFARTKFVNATYILSPFSSQFLTEQLFLPYILFRKRHDFSLFPAFPPGILAFSKILFFCYDATMWKYPKYLSFKNKLYFKPLSELALYRAKMIFTCSYFSLNELINYFPIIKSRVFSISAALPFVNISSKKEIDNLNTLNLPNKYILSVGSLEPRKNIPFLLQSIAPILIKNRISLVLTGRKAWGNTKIKEIISSLGISSLIKMTGYVTEKELYFLYKNAELFLFPSIYEGFGFPILEAFSCDCPVITSNTSSMPEVAGDAALIIDPSSADQIRNAVISILESKDLKASLIKKGTIRLKSFSWAICANNFLKYLDQHNKDKSV